ncbi:NUDIX domain-containing protein [Oryzobacter sp. R7]|uniref:NUDIX domain-containing protein n=1 Tax=Oryzobacter faecalis TaxID=3388656 RepID=UPI00398C9793
MPDEQVAPLRDVVEPRPVLRSELSFEGRVWDVRSEHVDLGAAGVVVRDFVDHTGAVAVLALDDEERVVVVQQYRHPVGAFEWELPAGLQDVAGEPPVRTAARELAEEADLTASQWHLLVDHYASPGGSSEALRVFLARGLADVPDHERHERDGEELGMPVRRVPLDDLVEAVLAGHVHNGTLMIAVLAAARFRDGGWTGLRSVDEPWPTMSRPRGSRS